MRRSVVVFAAAARTQHCKELAVGDLHADVIHRPHLRAAGIKVLDDVLQLNINRRHHPPERLAQELSCRGDSVSRPLFDALLPQEDQQFIPGVVDQLFRLRPDINDRE